VIHVGNIVHFSDVSLFLVSTIALCTKIFIPDRATVRSGDAFDRGLYTVYKRRRRRLND